VFSQFCRNVSHHVYFLSLLSFSLSSVTFLWHISLFFLTPRYLPSLYVFHYHSLSRYFSLPRLYDTGKRQINIDIWTCPKCVRGGGVRHFEAGCPKIVVMLYINGGFFPLANCNNTILFYNKFEAHRGIYDKLRLPTVSN
jgi:hypothetical protein